MNELKNYNPAEAETLDSREVAEMVEKQHKHLLRDIAGYISELEELGEPKVGPSDFFLPSTYQSAQGKQLPNYLITKKGCEFIGNKLTGAKGTQFTALYVTRFNRMEDHERQGIFALPQDYPSALRALADEAEKNTALAIENEAQRQTIADYTPKIEYVDKILNCKGTLAVTQIAADYGLSAKKLNCILHEEHVQWNVNGQWILYKKHMGQGYTKSVSINFTHSDGRPDTRPQTQWTQKGRLFIHELLKRRSITAIIDRELAGEQLAL